MIEFAISFSVIGMPAPQGSKTAIVRNGRAVVIEAKSTVGRERFKSWRQAVASAASDELRRRGNPPVYDGPVLVDVTFYLPRPKSAPKSRIYPASRPDLSKLFRNAEDAMTGIVYSDDSRIVECVLRKKFAVDRAPGAEIHVWGV